MEIVNSLALSVVAAAIFFYLLYTVIRVAVRRALLDVAEQREKSSPTNQTKASQIE
ncbi:hypothetical protein GCM10027417_00920 [Glutamicibacter endophyticus]